MNKPTTMPDQARFRPFRRTCQPVSSRRLRAALLLSAVLASGVAAPSRADQLYGFTDERGIFHFSDAPSDPRHCRLLGATPARAAGSSGATSRRLRASGELSRLIHDAARAARVDPALLEAVALVESSFHVRARSPKGALGLMQLMPATATRFGVADPFDPQQNLVGGARYLRELIDRFNTLPLALAAYNAGEGAVERHSRHIPPYSETAAYVRKC